MKPLKILLEELKTKKDVQQQNEDCTRRVRVIRGYDSHEYMTYYSEGVVKK